MRGIVKRIMLGKFEESGGCNSLRKFGKKIKEGLK